MNAEHILSVLIRANLVASAALLVVFALRMTLSSAIGASASYRLWWVVPAVVLAHFLPAPEWSHQLRTPSAAPDSIDLSSTSNSSSWEAVDSAISWVEATQAGTPAERVWPRWALSFWMTVGGLLLARSAIRSRQLARDPALGPALIGVFRPRLVIPGDFSSRFEPEEQRLVLAHEAAHLSGHHSIVNAAVEFVRCLNWVNPLVHIAARSIRADQEVACDAAVMAQHPGSRHAYALALLKSQTAHAIPTFGCSWPGRSPSLLRQRIGMLARRSPTRVHAALGVLAVSVLIPAGAFAAWTLQPDVGASASRVVPSVNMTQPDVQLPPGVLTSLEESRHARFLAAVANSRVDVVFFGDSAVDFWRYEWGGRAEWERSLAPLHACNFGVEGAWTKSILWRLQNGELDGIKPKVIVFDAVYASDFASHGVPATEIVRGNRAIIAEIRKRQPQAKVLLLVVPRGPLAGTQIRSYMKLLAEDFAALADDKSVFFLDTSAKFINADGTFDEGLRNTSRSGFILNEKGYAAWARAMQPKLVQLLR